MKKKISGLLPDNYPQLSFFLADILNVAPKIDRHSMEHPMFILSKKSSSREFIEYLHNDVTIRITPSTAGYATIWDKDILIYTISQLVAGQNSGRDVNRTVRFSMHDLLVCTNRGVGGMSYERLKDALTRLRGTTITTNIEVGGKKRTRGFGLVDSYSLVDGSNKRTVVEITLSKWLYDAVTGMEVLTINRDYFRLSGGLERRIYELARKHCGNQGFWPISMKTLFKKSGSLSTEREFRRNIKGVVSENIIPDYSLEFDDASDCVIVTPKVKPSLFELTSN